MNTADLKTRQMLAYQPEKQVPLHRLPFVGAAHSQELSFWDTPLTGGYEGGCRTGEALGNLMLKHLRNHGAAANAQFTLGHIVLSMMDRHAGVSTVGGVLKSEQTHQPEQDALRGQVVGFCSALNQWLIEATKHGGINLDAPDLIPKQVELANSGLILDLIEA